MTMVPRFQITSSFRTGIQKLDDDHQELVEHINAIAELEETAGAPRTLAALENFHKILTEHFGAEEASLRAAHYPGANAHLKHHAEILVALDRLIEDIRRDVPLEAPVASICFHELISVVLLRDMRFINWLTDRKLRGA